MRSLVRPYEVMIILDADLDEDAIRAATDRVVEFLRSRGGSPGRVDRWGKRRFAYELHHKLEGYYVVLEVSAEPALMAELDRTLFLADDVIRHKIILLPAAVAGRSRPGGQGEAVAAGGTATATGA